MGAVEGCVVAAAAIAPAGVVAGRDATMTVANPMTIANPAAASFAKLATRQDVSTALAIVAGADPAGGTPGQRDNPAGAARIELAAIAAPSVSPEGDLIPRRARFARRCSSARPARFRAASAEIPSEAATSDKFIPL